ncbi:MAG TPA: ABC transporter substrate-binding protein [Candidatus Bathyarchaeia archaeon]|nr:ABC transporter substrate-binding protein [Candidatus Bathyarchaeia archaeon]
MRRLLIICALLVALAAPVQVRPEQAGKPYRIGYLTPWYSTSNAALRLALLDALRARGLREGEEVVFESRYADGRFEQLGELAAQLAQLRVDVIVALSIPAGLAARGATSTIPIVVAANGDLAESGLVADAARPGGNVTGVQLVRPELAVRQLEILAQLVPGATRFAYLGNPDIPSDVALFRVLEGRAAAARVAMHLLPAKSESDYRAVFPRVTEQHIQGLIVGASVAVWDVARSIVRHTAQNKVPAIYPGREFVEAGGLVSYFVSASQQGQLVAAYVDRILKGARPGDLPVELNGRYELTINLRTARTLGLTIPPALRAQAADR